MTREELEKATEEYLKKGGKIKRLNDDLPNGFYPFNYNNEVKTSHTSYRKLFIGTSFFS